MAVEPLASSTEHHIGRRATARRFSLERDLAKPFQRTRQRGSHPPNGPRRGHIEQRGKLAHRKLLPLQPSRSLTLLAIVLNTEHSGHATRRGGGPVSALRFNRSRVEC